MQQAVPLVSISSQIVFCVPIQLYFVDYKWPSSSVFSRPFLYIQTSKTSFLFTTSFNGIIAALSEAESTLSLGGAIQVLHNPANANIGLQRWGGISKDITWLQRGRIKQMLMHVKCYTPVRASALSKGLFIYPVIQNWPLLLLTPRPVVI